MLLNLLLLLIIILLLIFLSMIWPPDSPWAPWWRTSDEKIRKALKLARVTSKDIVYDLGSGDGKVLIIAAKEFNARGIGVEIDPLRFYISKFLIKLNGVSDKITIARKDFFETDISEASVVFVYLVPNALKKLKPKFIKELKPGTRIVSIKYEIDLPVKASIPYTDKYKIRLYRIP